LILVGVAPDDDETTAARLANKCIEMRLFGSDGGDFESSLLDVGGEALVVSQFTLLADVRRGRRPSFVAAATGAHAEPLVEAFAAGIRARALTVRTGRFGAHMAVASVNDGPVTILLDSDAMDSPRRDHFGA
jgi:D-tyrosyl-tRNA(Tyr) deacylase